MEDKALAAITEIKEYSSKVYSTDYLNWWLLKYTDFYKMCIKKNSKLCEKCVKAEQQGLPYDCILKPSYCVKNSDLSKFINLYDELDNLTSIFKYETYCDTAINNYSHLRQEDEMRTWLISHYTTWNDILFMFCVDYLDTDSNDIDIRLCSTSDFSISLSRINFNKIEEFTHLCNVLFYERKLYPEKLKELEEEIEKAIQNQNQ